MNDFHLHRHVAAGVTEVSTGSSYSLPYAPAGSYQVPVIKQHVELNSRILRKLSKNGSILSTKMVLHVIRSRMTLRANALVVLDKEICQT